MAKDVCQYKFNLLPEHFQDHIMGLEQSWRKMNDAKFLNVVKEFKRADKKKCSNGKKKKSALQKKKCKESKGDDGDDGNDGNHAQKSKRQSHKKSRRDGSKNHKDSSGSKQCFCYLFKATGAPEFAYSNMVPITPISAARKQNMNAKSTIQQDWRVLNQSKMISATWKRSFLRKKIG